MTKVSVTVGRTINIGNFESIRLDFSITGTVKEGETSAQAWDRLYLKAETQLDKQSAQIEHMMDAKSSFRGRKPKK